MRLTTATSLVVALLLAGTASGCADDDANAVVQITDAYYQAAVRGDCTKAVTYASPGFRASGGATNECTSLEGYQIFNVSLVKGSHEDPPWVEINLRTPTGRREDQLAKLIRQGANLLINEAGGGPV